MELEAIKEKVEKGENLREFFSNLSREEKETLITYLRKMNVDISKISNSFGISHSMVLLYDLRNVKEEDLKLREVFKNASFEEKLRLMKELYEKSKSLLYVARAFGTFPYVVKYAVTGQKRKTSKRIYLGLFKAALRKCLDENIATPSELANIFVEELKKRGITQI